MIRVFLMVAATVMILASCEPQDVRPTPSGRRMVGQTEVLKWPGGKQAALSLTYDGGTTNQFEVALPLMNELDFPATFYIVTGQITGSERKARFLGRSIEEIVAETADTPTDGVNFFERASALRFAGHEESGAFHTQAGDLFELAKVDEAHALVDEAYALLRQGDYGPRAPVDLNLTDVSVTWDDMKAIAAQGHEFGSHTVSHAQLAILDEANLRYELEASRDEIEEYLGSEHTFSAECPYGTENERVMRYAFEIYPALRNRMPEEYVDEINRWNDAAPGESANEYVQWQRGPKTETPMSLMQSWVDTTLAHDNIWLVLVFHGVDGIGWEPKTGAELEELFGYVKSKEDGIWVATFKDVTRYIRERRTASVRSAVHGDSIVVTLIHQLDSDIYDLPLTLKTRVPDDWSSALVLQGEAEQRVPVVGDREGRFVQYEAAPNGDEITIEKGE